jgi:anti-sigma B factor antagonist
MKKAGPKPGLFPLGREALRLVKSGPAPYTGASELARAGRHRAGPELKQGVTMQIEERIVNNVTILDLKGKVTLGEGDEALKDKINSLVQQGHKRILLNLGEVPYIDSAGLGQIVRTYTTVTRDGGQLKLVHLTKRIEDLLMITKLLTVFETFDSESEAVKSYS